MRQAPTGVRGGGGLLLLFVAAPTTPDLVAAAPAQTPGPEVDARLPPESLEAGTADDESEVRAEAGTGGQEAAA
ncbi:MAG: hypothetical protein GEU81_01030 [Nitriliruptorales bacterium]|nr:hypothetical protein [Nitriliruptorales bacterium]